MPTPSTELALRAFARGVELDQSIESQASEDWRGWLRDNLPQYTTAPFAPRHERLWEWFTALTPGIAPRPIVESWPRGGAKSQTAELGVAWVRARRSRKYALIVSDTQDQADKHVGSIAGILEHLHVARAVNTYGSSKGWRRQELRTSDGFNVSAYGLDTAARGAKIDQYRPDLIVFDDVDSRHDTPKGTQKKIEYITQNIMPAGSVDCAVLFIQNLIHRNSIASMLVDGRADFLLDRTPASVERAVDGLEIEREERDDGTMRYRITAGVATWAGQSLATCESQINTWGRRAFLREAQQQVHDAEHGLWRRERDIEPFRVTQLPEKMRRIVVGVDPSAGGRDEAGIVVAGLGQNGHGYVIADRSIKGSSLVWAQQAVSAYHTYHADALVAEKNQGGDMVRITLQTVPGAPAVKLVHASKGKLTRAEPVQKLYEEGRIHHVGTFDELEDQMCSFEVGQDTADDRMDSMVWALTELMLGGVRIVGAPDTGGGNSAWSGIR